jgi:hypothetical protein
MRKVYITKKTIQSFFDRHISKHQTKEEFKADAKVAYDELAKNPEENKNQMRFYSKVIEWL